MLYSENLSKGDKNGSVADLQRRLNHQHFKVVGPDDGHFGEKTELAVVRFQDIFGLKQDGIVGPITQERLLFDGQVSAHFNIFHDVLYSRGNGDLIFRGEVIHRLERLRAVCGGRPIIVNSAYRDPIYNRAVNGAKKSQHMLGAAADIVIVGISPTRVAAKAREVGFTFTLVYSTFTHVDIR
jgi:hypothetical protein